MSSAGWYLLLVAAVGIERLVELVVARRNERWARGRGAVESGAGHYPPMVVLHAGLLVACPLEVWVADRPFLPWLGWPALAVVLAAQALRWWCIGTLGRQWNTRILVVPGVPLVARGPYRWLPHPNYVAVAAEVAALPLVHTAWVTAVLFSAANAVLLLRWRIPAEERALRAAADPRPAVR